VLVVEPATNVDDVVRAANTRLQDHQRIRAAAVWPRPELPRTEGTKKLKRRELRAWLTAGDPARAGHGGRGPAKERTVAAILERFAPGRTVVPETTIDELGLSSLERVELMMALEDTLQVTIDEGRFAAAATVADLEALARPLDEGGPSAAVTTVEPIDFPDWNRSSLVRAVRRASLPTWILPIARVFMRLEVEGLEHLRQTEGPVIFAANHQSHLDTPAILAALPPAWRYRLAPAMAKEFFKAHFYPEQFGRRAWLTNSLNYYLAAFFFNAFPLPQREAGTRQTLRYIGTLVGAGYSILIFPEGKRTDAGEINPFRAGVGMIASRLNVPVVPVRLEGLDRILHQKAKFATRGTARVAFGPPMSLTGSDYVALAARVEAAVRRM
jgi:long-chain acyl-CoA synthetase